jgi:AcrR family transcriptional regulator
MDADHSSASADDAPVEGGRRERNKRDKLARVVAAAREAFGRDGFEGANMRDVAAAAGIGAGTLFLYARTKEDLLVLVFRRELDPVIDAGFVDGPETDLLAQLIHCFRPITEYHARNLMLGRPFLKDLIFVSEAHAEEVKDFVARWNRRVAGLVDRAKERGEIRPGVSSPLLARCARQLFLCNLRFWVAGHVTREKHEAEVAAAFKLLLAGLGSEGRPKVIRPRVRRSRKTRRAE